jgi:hypothetical protein
MLPEWRHQELRELGGVVWTAGTGLRERYPGASVYARRWPRGPIIKTTTDDRGEFLFSGVGTGTFEVAVCSLGWNPWRGTVRLTGAGLARGDFAIELGQ